MKRTIGLGEYARRVQAGTIVPASQRNDEHMVDGEAERVGVGDTNIAHTKHAGADKSATVENSDLYASPSPALPSTGAIPLAPLPHGASPLAPRPSVAEQVPSQQEQQPSNRGFGGARGFNPYDAVAPMPQEELPTSIWSPNVFRQPLIQAGLVARPTVSAGAPQAGVVAQPSAPAGVVQSARVANAAARISEARTAVFGHSRGLDAMAGNTGASATLGAVGGSLQPSVPLRAMSAQGAAPIGGMAGDPQASVPRGPMAGNPQASATLGPVGGIPQASARHRTMTGDPRLSAPLQPMAGNTWSPMPPTSMRGHPQASAPFGAMTGNAQAPNAMMGHPQASVPFGPMTGNPQPAEPHVAGMWIPNPQSFVPNAAGTYIPLPFNHSAPQSNPTTVTQAQQQYASNASRNPLAGMYAQQPPNQPPPHMGSISVSAAEQQFASDLAGIPGNPFGFIPGTNIAQRPYIMHQTPGLILPHHQGNFSQQPGAFSGDLVPGPPPPMPMLPQQQQGPITIHWRPRNTDPITLDADQARQVTIQIARALSGTTYALDTQQHATSFAHFHPEALYTVPEFMAVGTAIYTRAVAMHTHGSPSLFFKAIANHPAGEDADLDCQGRIARFVTLVQSFKSAANDVMCGRFLDEYLAAPVASWAALNARLAAWNREQVEKRQEAVDATGGRGE